MSASATPPGPAPAETYSALYMSRWRTIASTMVCVFAFRDSSSSNAVFASDWIASTSARYFSLSLAPRSSWSALNVRITSSWRLFCSWSSATSRKSTSSAVTTAAASPARDGRSPPGRPRPATLERRRLVQEQLHLSRQIRALRLERLRASRGVSLLRRRAFRLRLESSKFHRRVFEPGAHLGVRGDGAIVLRLLFRQHRRAHLQLSHHAVHGGLQPAALHALLAPGVRRFRVFGVEFRRGEIFASERRRRRVGKSRGEKRAGDASGRRRDTFPVRERERGRYDRVLRRREGVLVLVHRIRHSGGDAVVEVALLGDERLLRLLLPPALLLRRALRLLLHLAQVVAKLRQDTLQLRRLLRARVRLCLVQLGETLGGEQFLLEVRPRFGAPSRADRSVSADFAAAASDAAARSVAAARSRLAAARWRLAASSALALLSVSADAAFSAGESVVDFFSSARSHSLCCCISAASCSMRALADSNAEHFPFASRSGSPRGSARSLAETTLARYDPNLRRSCPRSQSFSARGGPRARDARRVRLGELSLEGRPEKSWGFSAGRGDGGGAEGGKEEVSRAAARDRARVGWGGRKSARVGLGTRGSTGRGDLSHLEPVRGGGVLDDGHVERVSLRLGGGELVLGGGELRLDRVSLGHGLEGGGRGGCGGEFLNARHCSLVESDDNVRRRGRGDPKVDRALAPREQRIGRALATKTSRKIPDRTFECSSASAA